MRWPASDGWREPGRRSVHSALAGALDAVGLATHSDSASSAEHRQRLTLPAARAVCFVLVDGLGAVNLAARSGHAPCLRSFGHLEPLTTVAPSTTAAAITAVGTGELPGTTAMMGYSLRSPATGRPFSLIKWDDSGLDPAAWQSAPTLFEQLGPRASECRIIQPERFVGSGLTMAALRGAEAIVAETLEERVAAAAAALARGDVRAVYLYWGEVDHAGHAHGWTSQEWVAQLEHLDACMALLARSLPSQTLIVVTSDHGMVDVERRIDVSSDPALAESVSLVAGEERAVHVYTREPREVAARWREALGDRSLVMTKDEAVATGIFGTVGERAYAAMGDVLAFQTGRWSIVDERQRRAGQNYMVGLHGSLTEEEMLVPLIVEVV
ncbi:MAG: alkaline phosphatase family protein [Actinomycetaceae bacterium]|nr:alkaline phosphatase family protein [Actinomycetaceae bacterium]